MDRESEVKIEDKIEKARQDYIAETGEEPEFLILAYDAYQDFREYSFKMSNFEATEYRQMSVCLNTNSVDRNAIFVR